MEESRKLYKNNKKFQIFSFSSMLKYMSGAAAKICSLASAFSGLLLVGMVLLIAVTVTGRYFFSQPVTGANEILRLALLGVAFLALGEVELRNRHIKVKMFSDKLPDNVKLLLEFTISILSVGILVLLTWKSFDLAYENWVDRTETLVLGIPIYFVMFAMTIGAFFSLLSFLVGFFQSIINILERENLYKWMIPVIIFSLLIILTPQWLELISLEMDRTTVGVIGICCMFILLFSGAPVGTIMLLTGYAGTCYISNSIAGLSVLSQVSYSTASSYGWIILPLFMFMGNLVYHSGMAKDIYQTAHAWMGHYPGGLAMATVGGCTGFSAACGDSLSTATTMCMVSLPEMKRYKYDLSLATGAIAAGGTLGILIPPSLGFIIYGMLTDVSIGALFLAGIIPGIMLSSLFMLMIYLRAHRNPSLAPPGEKTSWKEKFASLKGAGAIIALFIIVIGGIYAGLFTPSEGGGMGAFGALVIALLKRRMNLENFFEAIKSTVVMNAAVFFILIGAMVLAHFITVCNIPMALSSLLVEAELNRWLILILVLFGYIIFGCIMNIMPAMIITLPIIFPAIVALGFDPVWFGVLVVITMEMGQITPPVGINVFAICSVAPDIPMGKVFSGIIPFLGMMLLAMIIIMLVPQIATFLPDLLM